MYNKNPPQELRCPGGLQEQNFLQLLRSTFPPLSSGRRFDILRRDRGCRLLRTRAAVLTPEELHKRFGSSTVFLRLKDDPDLEGTDGNCLLTAAEPPPGSPVSGHSERSSPVPGGENQNGVPSKSLTRQQEAASGLDQEVSAPQRSLLPPENRPLEPEQRTGLGRNLRNSSVKHVGVKKLLLRLRRSDGFLCKVCALSRGSVSMLIKHAWNHVDQRLCGVCGHRSGSAEDLMSHLQSHQKTLGCGVCGKCFLTAAGLRNHEVRHAGNRCSVCCRAFVEPSALQNHEPGCLGSHNATVHQSTHPPDGTAEHDPRQFHCSKCSKTFRASANLRVHMRVHTGEKPFRCPICNRGFTQSHCVKRHLRTHRDQEQSPVSRPVQ